jgi:hypothetical protein
MLVKMAKNLSSGKMIFYSDIPEKILYHANLTA